MEKVYEIKQEKEPSEIARLSNGVFTLVLSSEDATDTGATNCPKSPFTFETTMFPTPPELIKFAVVLAAAFATIVDDSALL